MSVATEARRATILDILHRNGFVTLANLCDTLRCSAATVRRDLEVLQRAGGIQRTHGGAVLNGARELPFAAKITEMADAKRRIADMAAQMVTPGMTIGFSGGTTTQCVACRLAQRADHLTVVTNAVTVAMELAGTTSRIILTGGELRNETFELVGPLTEPAVAQIHIDLFIAGVDGLSAARGLTTYSLLEARINRVLIERSDQVMVVADHTKLGRKTLAQIVPLNMARCLVTDQEADEAALAELAAAGLQVHLA